MADLAPKTEGTGEDSPVDESDAGRTRQHARNDEPKFHTPALIAAPFPFRGFKKCLPNIKPAMT
jgi:hypothetical protein